MAAESASAKKSCTPLPGRSGLDQYCETIPGPTGDRSAGSGSGTGRHVSSSTRRRLKDSGSAGQALLGVIGGSSGSGGSGTGGGKGSANGKSSGGGSKSSSEAGANDEPSGNVLSAVKSAADSGSTIGPGFVWVIAILALALAAVAWIRYRVRGRST